MLGCPWSHGQSFISGLCVKPSYKPSFNNAALGTSKSGVALRILGVAPTVGEKGVALKLGETAASHLTPLFTPGELTVMCHTYVWSNGKVIYLQTLTHPQTTHTAMLTFVKPVWCTIENKAIDTSSRKSERSQEYLWRIEKIPKISYKLPNTLFVDKKLLSVFFHKDKITLHNFATSRDLYLTESLESGEGR